MGEKKASRNLVYMTVHSAKPSKPIENISTTQKEVLSECLYFVRCHDLMHLPSL